MDVDEGLLKFCRSLPKIELHAHLNGCARISTLRELAIAKGLDDVALSVEGYNNNASSNSPELSKTSNSPSATAFANENKKSLPQYFNFFNLIHQLTTSLDVIQRITREAIEDFAADNVRYLEIRTSPKSRPEHGITKENYVEAVLAGIEDYYYHSHNKSNSDIDVRLLLSIDRRETSEQAVETALLALKFREKQKSNNSQQNGFRIVGLDLAGDPSLGHWDQWRPAFDLARTGGLKISLHCAEIWNEEESAAMIQWGPHRLGHMVCMGSNLINLLVESKIPVEVCLTSNVKTGSVDGYDSHHFRDLYDLNRYYHPSQCDTTVNGEENLKNEGEKGESDKTRLGGNVLVLCTDDPSQGIFDTTLSREYALAATTFGLSKEELCRLAAEAVHATFLNREEKEELKRDMLAALKLVYSKLVEDDNSV